MRKELFAKKEFVSPVTSAIFLVKCCGRNTLFKSGFRRWCFPTWNDRMLINKKSIISFGLITCMLMPKINLIPIPGYHQGIRYDDLILLTGLIYILLQRKIFLNGKFVIRIIFTSQDNVKNYHKTPSHSDYSWKRSAGVQARETPASVSSLVQEVCCLSTGGRAACCVLRDTRASRER